MEKWAYDFLEKPLTPEIVTETVVRAWKGLRTDLENRKLLAELRRTNEELQVEIKERKRAQETLRKAHHDLERQVAERTSELVVSNEKLRSEIAERKLTEEALRKARADAEASNMAKSEFLSNMSHEIRTPMNAITGFIDLALETELTKEQQEYLEIVKGSADFLLRILNDILDLTRIEVGRRDMEEIDFDLRTTQETAMDTLALKAYEQGLEIACYIKPQVPISLVGDPGRLRQIITNLGGNAIKFTETGEVLISCEVESRDKETVSLHFSVSDTGIGIPEDKLDAIFDSFQQVDGSTTRKYGGTGLGLSISRQLLEMMGGRIWVESESGKGSTFHFTARFGVQPGKKLLVHESEPIDLQAERVLIVDDNSTVRRILREMVSTLGLSHGEARDGKSALAQMEKAAKDGNPYGLILLDAHLPQMDGFEVSEHIKKNPMLAQTRIILLTSMGQRGDANRCKGLGILAYLPKPVKQSELFDAITSVVRLRHATLDPALAKTCLVTRHTIREERQRRGLTILVAEDNRVSQKLAVILLEKQGHSVVVAGNGQEAVDLLDKHSFDLALMDVQMPVMDGFEATQLIREREKFSGSHVPIIAMTAHTMDGDRDRCLKAGMDGYISKPFKVAELLQVIKRWGLEKEEV